MDGMSVSVEFYGIPRQRTGVAAVVVECGSLGEIVCELATRFPALAETCFDGPALKPGFVVNVDGDRFVRDPDATIADGAAMLILSADAGG